MRFKDRVLRRKTDFTVLYERGQTFRSSHIVLVVLRTREEGHRNAVVASRKVGSAVRRNRAKRLLREAHRRLRPDLKAEGVNLALIARPSSKSFGVHQALAELEWLYTAAGLLESKAVSL